MMRYLREEAGDITPPDFDRLPEAPDLIFDEVDMELVSTHHIHLVPLWPGHRPRKGGGK